MFEYKDWLLVYMKHHPQASFKRIYILRRWDYANDMVGNDSIGYENLYTEDWWHYNWKIFTFTKSGMELSYVEEVFKDVEEDETMFYHNNRVVIDQHSWEHLVNLNPPNERYERLEQLWKGESSDVVFKDQHNDLRF